MKAKYDFSKAEKGKFYRQNVIMRMPIYLEPDVEASINRIAHDRNGDIQKLINEWLRASIKVVESVPASQ